MKKSYIEDVEPDEAERIAGQVIVQTEKLSEEFGRNLDTVVKARQWLTNPYNWHDSNMWIVRWDGLLPTVSRTHGKRLINEPNDNGLPEVIVREQRNIRMGHKDKEECLTSSEE